MSKVQSYTDLTTNIVFHQGWSYLFSMISMKLFDYAASNATAADKPH